MTTRFFRYILLCLAVLTVCGAARPAFAQTYSAYWVYSFCSRENGSYCTDGEYPSGAIVEDSAGNFYGTAEIGGASDGGTVFKITSVGFGTLYSFCPETGCKDGERPTAALTLGTDGNYYSTTSAGGASDYGTVFKITPSGTFTSLYSFCGKTNCPDGETPYAGLVLGKDGNFYGTTYAGGVNDGGTVFKITPSGTLTTLYSFCSQTNCTDGYYPYAALVQGTDGNFYGTTKMGGTGSPSGGTVFKVTPSGTLTTLYSFCSQTNCTDGEGPYAGLVQGTDGNFYGTTVAGGTSTADIGGNGTAFKITPTGTLTSLYSFCTQTDCTDGQEPYGGLIQAKDGNFYGTTSQGGDGGYGTAYEVTSSGVFTTIYTFTPAAINSKAALLEVTGGVFYGTSDGVPSNQPYPSGSTVFGLSLPTTETTYSLTSDPVTVGQLVTFQANVFGSDSGTPTGTVTFSANGTALNSCTLSAGTCSFAASAIGYPLGTYDIVAAYSGSTSYAGSTSPAENIALEAAPTSTTLKAGTNPVTPPATETLTATVKRSTSGATGTPTGTVTFYAGTTVIGTSSLNSSGVATFTASTKGIGAGTYPVTAKYNGDANDTASTSSPVSVVAQ